MTEFLAEMFGSRPVEITAVLLGFCNIALLIRRSIWNYPVGMLMVTLYAFIFFEARLYSDMLLQGFFFTLQAYGWWYWQQGIADSGDVVVRRLETRHYPLLMVVAMTGVTGLGYFMSTMTNAALPYWDATTTVLSVLAQLLLARRYIENWALWIFVDVLAIGIYYVKDLQPTMLLYAVFLVMSCWGLYQWFVAMRSNRMPAA